MYILIFVLTGLHEIGACHDHLFFSWVKMVVVGGGRGLSFSWLLEASLGYILQLGSCIQAMAITFQVSFFFLFATICFQ